MYSSNDFERLFIRYKVEAMPRKSMVQGYKTSIEPSLRTDGNGDTTLKVSILFPYSGKKGKCGILSCKNDDRHPYDIRNTDTATKLNLSELEKSDRFSLSCLNQIYFLI